MSLDRIFDQKALSMKRLEDFFSQDDYKFNSTHTYSCAIVCSATQKMQKQLQAFDQAFNVNDSTTGEQARREMSGTNKKNKSSAQSGKLTSNATWD